MSNIVVVKYVSFTKVSIFDLFADLNISPGKITPPVTTKNRIYLSSSTNQKEMVISNSDIM